MTGTCSRHDILVSAPPRFGLKYKRGKPSQDNHEQPEQENGGSRGGARILAELHGEVGQGNAARGQVGQGESPAFLGPASHTDRSGHLFCFHPLPRCCFTRPHGLPRLDRVVG